MEYKWDKKFATIGVVDAQVVGERIEALREQKGNALKPADVVEDARPDDAPTHGLFEWNDMLAANHWRQNQAREVLRSIRIVMYDDQGVERQIIANVHVELSPRNHAYVPIQVAIADDDMRQQILAEALRYLRGWQARYEHLEALRPVVRAIEEVAGKLRPVSV